MMVLVMVAVIMLLIVEVIQGMKRGVDIDVSLSILFVHSNEHDQYATCEKKDNHLLQWHPDEANDVPTHNIHVSDPIDRICHLILTMTSSIVGLLS